MALPRIPYATQCIDDDDIAAVVGVLKSEWLTQGPNVPAFERKVAEYCGAKHAVAVSSGTAGLHLACLALDLAPSDVLWTSPNSFVASANCARYCGADVDFVDIDSRTYNISAAALEDKLCNSAATGRLPKIVIPVHYAGQPAELAAIRSLSDRYGFSVIEDAAQGLGAVYDGERVGNCRFSDITVFSFHPTKIVTTGEGGVVTTNSDEIYRRLLRLRTHGITRDQNTMHGPWEGPWYYQQLELGLNYRMTDIQAALGHSQLAKIDRFVARRTALAARYDDALSGLPLVLPWQHPGATSAWHLYAVRLQSSSIGKTRRDVFEFLQTRGIGANVHYIPIHTHPYYRRLGFRIGQFPEAERFYREAISLPLFPKLNDDEQDRVVEALQAALQRGSSFRTPLTQQPNVNV